MLLQAAVRSTVSLPEWVFAFRARVPRVLDSYFAGRPGWYRPCAGGSLLEPSAHAGLGFSCLAAKTAIQCGLWDSLSGEHRRQWIAHLQSFQRPPGPPDHGMFSDPAVEKAGLWRHRLYCVRHRLWEDLFRASRRNRWAETRQAMSTLFALGARPLHPVTGGYPLSPTGILRFCERLEWSAPWSAGAQLAHLLFFLRHGAQDAAAREEGRGAVLEFLARLQSSASGGWHSAGVSNQACVNGAMKILSGLYWWGEPCPRADALARTATADIDGAHDCSIVNRLFVLHRLAEQSGRVAVGADRIAQASLEMIPRFFQVDGGLSSSGASLTYYYNARVSEGRPVGDLHGLFLFTWAITLSAHLLGEQDRLGWRLVAP